jgi:hypothetical protein
MKNRGAAFGILVTTDFGAVPSLVAPYGDDKLIVRVPVLEDAGFDMLSLSAALEMGRWKAIMSRTAPGNQMDVNRVNAHVEGAIQVLNRFSEMKRKMTALKGQVDSIGDYADDIRRDLAGELQSLRSVVAQDTGAVQKVA